MRDLVVDAISQGVGATVASTIRETVIAVEKLAMDHPEGAPNVAVAKELGLDKSTTLRRLRAAMAKGHVINEEERPGHRGRYKVGDPLPEDVVVLPMQPPNQEGDETPGQTDGCRVAIQSEGAKDRSGPSEPCPDLPSRFGRAWLCGPRQRLPQVLCEGGTMSEMKTGTLSQ